MMEPVFVSSLMAHDTFLKDWSLAGERDPASVTKYLNEIKAKYGFFSAFFVSARSMNYYHCDGVLKRIDRGNPHDVWYFQFVKSRQEHELVVDTDEATSGTLTIFINFRMHDYEGNLLGVAGVGIKMSLVAELLDRTQAKYNKRIYLTDRDGLVQVHSEKKSMERRSIRDMEGIRSQAGLILDERMPASNYEYDAGGHHILLTTRYIPELTWFLMVEDDETASLREVRANLFRSLGVGFAASLLVIAICLYTVHSYQKRIESQATTDELTGLANRREFQSRFAVAAYLCQRRKRQAALILMDIDGFKAVNDCHGHLAGDRMIVEVAGQALSALRPSDCLARWGGDEFIALVMCPMDTALAIAERIRALVEAAGLPDPTKAPRCSVTMSCGVAELLPGDDLDAVIHRADNALYRAKQSGRNRVFAA
jgi:diguanylate cyclase (GGDEF)-like protein